MDIAVVYTRANLGIDAPLVSIEVHISNGLPAFNLVGLPEASVKEARDRVRSAMINSGFEFPSRRITVNMAPADLPKGGGRFDLAIAIGIIAAHEGWQAGVLEHYEFAGELALSGEIRPLQGVLPIALSAAKSGRCLILPEANENEATLISDAHLLIASNLFAVYAHLTDKQALTQVQHNSVQTQPITMSRDISDVAEQAHAKRALAICASGGHNLLLFGPAGTGKSMLANRLLSILPDLTPSEAIEVAAVRSVCGETVDAATWLQRPFRQPHHSSSPVALVGGGASPKPGEITLAHKGVLFLDELPEFGRKVLDSLREPLETGEVHLSRAKYKVCYPANFQLIAAMNPSPTGDIDDKRCTPDQILRYLNKVSGPLLDRIDLQVNVPRVDLRRTIKTSLQQPESSKAIKEKVVSAHAIQLQRQGCLNAHLSTKQLDEYASISEAVVDFLATAIDSLGLSMRAYHRTLKVARSIADFEGSADITKPHVAEALSYRGFDQILKRLSRD